jgi:DNA-binding transcriptional ArsR family regulator
MSTPHSAAIRNEDQLDAVFHALSDRTRRGLIRRLAQGPAMITELAVPFEMTFAAVSKHLRVLEKAKLVRRAVDGRIHRCTLSGAPMFEADRWIQQYTAFWEDTLDTLADFVDKNQGDPIIE